MTEVRRQGFFDGERHGWMAAWCDDLAQILAGRDAERLLAEGLPAEAGVVVLPSFTWQQAAINMGRKDRSRDGGRLLMPIRMVWSEGTVCLVAPGDGSRFDWSASGLGVELDGSVAVEASRNASGVLSLLSGDVPHEGTMTGVLEGDQLRVAVESVAAAGRDAWWKAITSLEKYADRAVRNAHRYITRDTAPGNVECVPGAQLLDDQAIASCTDRLLLGDPDHPDRASSAVRLLNRSLQPAAFSRVDPEMFTQRAIRRDAQLEVRRCVGDPSTGSKIRQTARDLGITEPDGGGAEAVLREYRLRHPRDRMGLARIRKAMTVRPVEVSTFVDCFDMDRGVEPWPSTRLA